MSAKHSVYLASSLSFGIGLLVLLGHAFGIAFLTSILPSAPEMVSFTASGFVLASLLIGLVIYKESKPKQGLTFVFYLGLVLLAFSSLAMLLGYWQPFGFFQELLSTLYPKPSSPQTLICFLLLSLALLSLHTKRLILSQSLALTSTFTALLMFLAYLSGVEALYLFNKSLKIGMAIHTALCFLLLSYSILALNRHKGLISIVMSQGQSGKLIRRLMLLVIVMPILVVLAITKLGRLGIVPVAFELTLFASLNTLLSLVLIWSFARQFNRLEIDLLHSSAQLGKQHEELEQAYKQIENNQTFLYNVLDSLSEVVGVSDSKNNYLMVNEAGTRLAGVQRKDLLGKPVRSLNAQLFDEDMQPLPENHSNIELTRQSKTGRLETIMGIKFGDNLRWSKVTTTLITLMDGSEGAVTALVDITEVQEAKRALANRNQQLEQLNQQVTLANKKLEQSETFLIDVLNNLSEAVFVVDASGTSTFANSKAVEFTGQTLKEVTDPANSVKERFFFDEQGERLAPEDYRISLALKEGQASLSRIMGYQRKSDGKFMWLQANINRLTLTNGSLGFVATYQDITEPIEAKNQLALKNEQLEQLNQEIAKANSELKQKETFLNDVLNNLSESIFVVDPSGQSLYVNQEAIKLTGQTREEVLDPANAKRERLFFNEQGERLPPESYRIIKVLQEGQASFSQVMGYQRQQDNKFLWLQVNINRLRLSSDSMGYVASYLDITEQVEAKNQLSLKNKQLEQLNKEVENAYLSVKQNEIFLNTILNNLAEAVFVLDDEGNYLLINNEAIKLAGQNRETVLTPDYARQERKFFNEAGELLAPEDYRIIHVMQKTPGNLNKVIGYQDKDEDIVWLKASVNRLKLKDGSDGFVGSYLDISEQIRAKELLQVKNEQLERSNSELQEFAFVASHDLQEPLLKIRAFIDRFIEKETGLSERSQEYLRRMNNAAERMQTLITDILELSRITTRAKPFEPVDLNVTLDNVKQDLEKSLEASGAEIIAETLPKIEADPGQIERLFLNLLSNSLKYRKADEKPRIQISTRRFKSSSGRYFCQLSFEDNGIGFDNQYQDKIFIMFQRLHGRSEYDGTGVGLAICRKIVERHGGSIEAFGKVGKGARFDVQLPIRQV